MVSVLHDRAKIYVQAGAGGDGSTSFRREAHVPRGGPDGGDGGRGGDVVVVCDDSLRDLQSFKRRSHSRAGRGGHGSGSQRHGADGETLTIKVPPGTQIEGVSAGRHDGELDDDSSQDGTRAVRDDGDGDLLGRRWELLADGQEATIARGGSGGKGNKRFATPTRQAPRFAERGLVGEESWLELRLRLLADVGLVGLPNAGKSSLLSRLTRAAPKIADYPFTTLSPVLGVLDAPFGAQDAPERQLIVADIPGLIEGASDGAGLGHDFLAHVERTRLLVHVLDVAPEISMGDGADAVANHATIERELAAHDERLARLPRVLALSKADLVPGERAREAIAEWQQRLGPEVPVVLTSSATGAGVRELAELLLRLVPDAAPIATQASAPADQQVLVEHMVFRPRSGAGFQVEQLREGAYAIRGRGIERLLERFDVDNEDAMAYLEGRLRRIGVLGALEAKGFQPGDDIEIAGVTFELDPHE
jgi:GTP-binding protein